MDDTQQFHTVRGYQIIDQHRNVLTPALEDYLEMIYRNNLVEGYMRINTLSDLLNVSPPSATRMVQKLTKLELVNYRKYGIISLTKTGTELGRFLYERHCIVECFLKNLGVKENALIETELIEHSVSRYTVNKLKLFNDYLEANPAFLQQFEQYTQANQANQGR
jgi:DtxR family transcriptional regulator, Mn-dependent transcriptional regulator